MSISETFFFQDYERVEERHNRLMPAKPRSVLIAEARAASANAVASGQRRTAAAMEANDRLERLRRDAPELVGSLGMSRSAWRAATQGAAPWLRSIEAARVRWQMEWLVEHGLDAALRGIESDVRSAVGAATDAEAVAASMPEDAAAEAAYAAWERSATAALDEIVAAYDGEGA